ncbi:MAG: PEP-CTERM sorting domain-containing protein [Bryobacterales bacterium]|nr:PEP-CTERM sorting domain-containing protein [Bryobacterales bacterium]
MRKALILGMLATAVSHAAVLYNNTTGDQQFSAVYSTGFTHIGDRVQLGAESTLDSLDTQFYNVGTDATFDATVTFYEAGSPLGNAIGSSFTVTGISITGATSQTVSFTNLGSLLVPADLVVIFTVQNVSAGGDIGVNFFDPPSVGTSSNTFFITNDGTGFAESWTLLDIDNLYLLVNGDVANTGIPEPGTWGLVLGALGALAYRRSRHS